MPYQVRRLTDEDTTAAWQLGAIAFGYHGTPMPEDWRVEMAGRVSWGAFDESGRLVAKAVDREQAHWFGGRAVPASGIAGVAVAPESRGAGLARSVLTRLLAEVRTRGAVISTLFDTTPVPYRRLGWEEVGALTYTAFPASTFAGVVRPQGITLRPATEADVPALQAIYRAVARSGAGMMERSGPLFSATPVDMISGFHGVSVAVAGDGTVTGYASWDRSRGYDSTGSVTVFDLMCLTPEATAALLSMLGRWESVAPTIVLRLPDGDPALLEISSAAATVHRRQPWMLRVVDLPGAIAARGWPPVEGTVDLDVLDTTCSWHAGAQRLVLSGGEGRVEPGGRGTVRLSARGLSLLYAGAGLPANLRRAGLLSGDAASDDLLAAAFAGPRPSLIDYF